MDLTGARIVLRRRGLGEILDLSLRWCATLGAGLYLRLALVVLLPCVACCHYVFLTDTLPFFEAWGLVFALWLVVQGVFTVAASRLLFETGVTARAVLGLYLRRSWAHIGALIGTALCVGLGAALLIVGSMWAWVLLTFVHEATLLEGQGPLRALARARQLSRFQFGDLFGFWIGLTSICLLIVISTETIGDGLVSFVLQLGEPLGSLETMGWSLYAIVGAFVTAPFVATVRFLKYIDGRTRQDGWDIQLRFLRIQLEDEQAEEARA